MNFLKDPWPWWVAGPLIGLTVPLLLLLGNRTFGISSSLRHICAACFPSKIPFFQYNWKKETWNLVFALGIAIGAFIAWFLFGHQAGPVDARLVSELKDYGIAEQKNFLPVEVFNWNELLTVRGLIMTVFGGFLVGFGTRYAGGCTSGHSIMGMSNLQWPSLVATICFMTGGFLVANFILPFILR